MNRQRFPSARPRSRRLLTETLEPRLLLANDVPFQNPIQQFDVNRDLRISALDALQVINFIGRNGIDFVLPQVNRGDNFPDVNGIDGVSSLDALQVINRLSPFSPFLTGRLVTDSAPGNTQNLDFITNQYSLEFGVEHAAGSEQLEVRINGTASDPFVSSGALSEQTALLLNEAALNAIAGGPLADGDHFLEVRIAGEDPVASFVLTIDKTAPESPNRVQLSSASDSGISNTDGITNIQTLDVQGDAESGSLVSLLIDGEQVGQTLANSPWQISAGTLDEGAHSATAMTEDVAGNVSEVSSAFPIAVDLTPPDEPVFDLDPVFDTTPTGDQQTHFRRVGLLGQTTADVRVELIQTRDMRDSDAGGAFAFDRVPLVLGDNPLTARATDVAGNQREFGLTIALQNQAPQIDAVDPLSIMPGDRLEVTLSGSDGDGDSLTFSIDSSGDRLPSGSLSTNRLIFQPTPADVGSYQFTLGASDGIESTTQQVTLDVVADTDTSTRISGQILNTNSQALENVRVSIGDVEAFTDSGGLFQLGFGRNALPSDTLRVHADELTLTETYPFIAEKLPLLFDGRNVIGGINNIISRPIFLPALDTANAVTIDPTQDMTITTTAIPDVELHVAAGSLMSQDGTLFDGELSITEVPFDITPAALPEGWVPGTVVTIQPGDMVFTQPAPLDFPNREGWAPGFILDLMSINPVTGEFDDVGDLQVSADGTRIETISGGVRNSSWHGVQPPPDEPPPNADSPDCNECDESGQSGSTVSFASGAITEVHDLVSYQSLGRTRGLTLSYDSLRADPRPVFHVGFDDVDPDLISMAPEGLLVATRVGVFVDGVEIVSPGFDQPGKFGLMGGENFFAIPAGSGPLDVAVQVDLRDQPTGVYPYRVSTGIRNLVDISPTRQLLVGGASVTSDELLHVNSIDSPLGSGWGIEGLLQIVEGPDGSVAIIDGDGSEVRFTPGARQIQDFLAPNQANESVQRFDGITGGLRGDLVQPGAGRLNNPHNPTFGGDGNLYVVSDSGGAAAQILRYDGASGEFLDVFVDTGEGGFTGAAEQAFAPDGSLYLATVANLGVLRFDRFGNFIDSIAGPVDGVQQACGIEFGPDGLLYVWDTLDEEMRRFDPATGDLVDVFIAPGNMANACDFDFGTDGDIFITDLTFSEIRRFSGVDGSFLGTFANTNPGASGITFGPDENFYANIGGNTHRFDGQTGEFIDEFVSGLGGFNNFTPPPPEGISKEFLNPAGDFSKLERLPNGTYRQTTPDQTVLTFNEQNKLASIVDRNGNATTFEYDDDANITKITDPVGLETTFTYTNDHISSITDPANRVTQLQHDVDGNLIRITDPDGTSRRFTYDDDHHMIGETDKRGNQEFEFYDEFGRATGAILADGSEIVVTPRQVRGLYSPEMTNDPANPPDAIRTGGGDAVYVDANGNSRLTMLDGAGQRVTSSDDIGALPTYLRDEPTNLVTNIIDARGNETTLAYDLAGNLISIADQVGVPRTFTYDDVFNQLTTVTDELGRVTLFGIDPSNGNTDTITRVVGEVGGNDDVSLQLTYTSEGTIDTIVDPLGRVTDFDYDSIGRLVSITEAVGTPDESTLQFEYDAAGNRTALIDALGRRTQFDYDSMNRPVRVTDPDPDEAGPLAAPFVTAQFDAAGNVTMFADALGRTTQFEYDSRHRQISKTDFQGNQSRFAYDGLGNLISSIDPLGNETTLVYDVRSRLIESIDPAGGRVAFGYDLDDNLATITDPLSNTTTLAYDFRNRVLSETDEQNGTTIFAYDIANQLSERVDRNGRTVHFDYDELGQRIRETWIDDGNVIEYTYDRFGNLLTAVDDSSSLAFTYDNLDRVATVDNSGTGNAPMTLLTYDYDAVGNLISFSDTVDSAVVGVNAYAYDQLDRLVSVTQSGAGVSEKRVDFSYNPLGQFETISRFANISGNQPVMQSTFVYDTLNRLTRLSHGESIAPVAFFDFTYDAADRITSIEDVDGTTAYAYDPLGQLLGSQNSDLGQSDESYTYDDNGNRVSSHLHGSEYTVGLNNRLESDGTFDYQYDAEGNVIRRTAIESGDFREFEWDFRDRLRTVVDRDAEGVENQRVQYTYDALDRRISKSVETATDSVLTHFVHDRDDVLLEFVDSDGAAGPSDPQFSKRFLFGEAVDQILAQEDAAGNVLWHLTDHLGTVRDLVDSSGTVVNHIQYDSFGNVLEQSDASQSTPYLFTGREFDDETGLYYYRSRYYDASVGRFLSEDTVGFSGGDANLYRYVGNAPTLFTDPSGRGIERDDGLGSLRAQLDALRAQSSDLIARSDALRDRLRSLQGLIDEGNDRIKNIEEQLRNLDICPKEAEEAARRRLNNQLMKLRDTLQRLKTEKSKVQVESDQLYAERIRINKQLLKLQDLLGVIDGNDDFGDRVDDLLGDDQDDGTAV